jgi:hypothetical protein
VRIGSRSGWPDVSFADSYQIGGSPTIDIGQVGAAARRGVICMTQALLGAVNPAKDI